MLTKITLHSYTFIPARFPRIEGASGIVSEHHTSKSGFLLCPILLSCFVMNKICLNQGQAGLSQELGKLNGTYLKLNGTYLKLNDTYLSKLKFDVDSTTHNLFVSSILIR